jgi:mannose-6-phosphate isomerase-like protein (cupin superfamily)
MERMTPEQALARLGETGHELIELYRRGSLTIEIYKPHGIDRQQPHSRDELYVVIAGTGSFVNGEMRHRFGPGEVLCVRAGVEHRFEDFSEDFVTWVFFYGPEGGESERE